MSSQQDHLDPFDGLEDTSILGVKDGKLVNVPVWLNRPKPQQPVHYDVKWLNLFLDDNGGLGMSLLAMCKDKRLTGTDLRVRDYMFCKVGMDNCVHVNQSEAAEYLGIARPHVCESIKKLIELEIVLEGPSEGKFRSYQINPLIAHRGSLKKGVKEKKAALKTVALGKVLQFPKQP